MMQKTNWIVFIGQPNVGKSTLVNQLVGEKVSIVTPKAQTTRQSLRGIKVEGDTQLIFIDTPGIFDAKTKAEKLMVRIAWQQIVEADEVCVMVDAKKALEERSLSFISHLKSNKIFYNLIINKIDKVNKLELLNIATKLNELYDFKNTFMVSALKNKAVDDLSKYFMKTARPGDWMFDEDQITSAPLYFMASEIVREKIFFNTHEEIPYNVDVEASNWEEKKGVTLINIDMLVVNSSHKKIIIGKHGALLKKIGTQARKEIERLLDTKVFLQLYVKIKGKAHL